VPRTSFPVSVEPSVLLWARTSIGLSQEEAATKAKVLLDDILEWESGNAAPTFVHLKRMSSAYKRSTATLMLPAVPKRAKPPVDLRTLPNQHSHPLTTKTLKAIRRAERVQAVTVELAESMGVALKPSLPSLVAATDPEAAAGVLRRSLLTGETNPRPLRDKQKMYECWRTRAERLGVLVVQATLDRHECRAFALANDLAPLVLVNSVEYPAPRSFSLIHELAHLALRASALCDMEEPDTAAFPASSVEVFCNHVAGAVLVPTDEMMALPQMKSHGGTWSDSELDDMAIEFGVSKEVMLRRLLIHGATTKDYYEAKRQEWREKHRDMKDYIPHVPEGKKPLNRNGLTFSTLVAQAQRGEVISLREAADFLGTKPKHMKSFESYLAAARLQR